jgi:hypothetical protein
MVELKWFAWSTGYLISTPQKRAVAARSAVGVIENDGIQRRSSRSKVR